MIGLLIQDNAYEQDIRELLMSFYPGETYAHEVKENIDFYVQTRLKDGEAVIGIWEKLENGEESAGAAVNAAGVEAKDSAVAVEKQTDVRPRRTGRLDTDRPFCRKSRLIRPLRYQKCDKKIILPDACRTHRP